MGLTKDEEIIKACQADVQDLGKRGIRSLAIAKTNAEGEWEMLGTYMCMYYMNIYVFRSLAIAKIIKDGEWELINRIFIRIRIYVYEYMCVCRILFFYTYVFSGVSKCISV